MQPSTLDPSFYAVSMDQNLTKPTAVKSRTLSPVAIQQSYLPQSYHAPLPAKSYSPSVPYSQRTCTNALGLLDDRDQTLIGLTTQSATLDATFYGQSPDGTRLKDANDDKGHIPRDSISSAYLDQTSQLSGSMSSKVDSNGVTSLRLTDDEWTSNPSSPDRLPSADLMDRIIKSPTDNTIKDAVIESQFTSYQSERTYEAPESSSHGFIQHDPKIQVVPLAQASDLTPSIACFHGMVSSQTSPSMTDTTPRAASQRVLDTAAQPDSEWRSLKEMDHIDMALEPDSPDRLPSSDLMGRLIQTPTDGTINRQFLRQSSLAEGPPELTSEMILNDDAVCQTSLAEISEISLSIVEFHRRQETIATETQLPGGKGGSMLRTLQEMEGIDMMDEPTSPDRLPSADLMGRLTMSPVEYIEKQFVGYSPHYPGLEPESSSVAALIGVDRQMAVVSLSDASSISPSIANFHQQGTMEPERIGNVLSPLIDLSNDRLTKSQAPPTDVSERAVDPSPAVIRGDSNDTSLNSTPIPSQALEGKSNGTASDSSGAALTSIAQSLELLEDKFFTSNDEAASLATEIASRSSEPSPQSLHAPDVLDSAASSSSSNVGQLSPIYAISTDQLGTLSTAKRHPITDENHRASVNMSHRMSLIRASPSPLPIDLDFVPGAQGEFRLSIWYHNRSRSLTYPFHCPHSSRW